MTDNPWLYFPRRRPLASMRLFCLPFAGGGASAYRAWPDGLPEWIEPVAIQLPGREGRFAEPALRELRPALHGIRAALAPLLDRPYALFGHSMGSVIAFELVRLLRREGLPLPRHLFVSGRRAPQLPLGRRAFQDLPDMELVAEIRKLSGDANGLFDSEEMRALLLPMVRADFALHDSYAYQDEHPLDVPVSVFGGLDDETTSEQNLRAWQAHTLLPIRLGLYPGGHFFVDSSRREVLQALAETLASAAPTAPRAAVA